MYGVQRTERRTTSEQSQTIIAPAPSHPSRAPLTGGVVHEGVLLGVPECEVGARGNEQLDHLQAVEAHRHAQGRDAAVVLSRAVTHTHKPTGRKLGPRAS